MRARLIASGLTSRDLKDETPRPRSLGKRLIKSRSSGRFLRPARAFCPFVPRPEVFPRVPPRPTCWLVLRFVFAFRVLSCMLFVFIFDLGFLQLLKGFDCD